MAVSSDAQAVDQYTQRAAVYKKAAWRIVPFLCLCLVAAYLDRVNVGFAKLQMMDDLAFSNTVYGIGAGIFFLGYVIFEVPSNMLLHRVGASMCKTQPSSIFFDFCWVSPKPVSSLALSIFYPAGSPQIGVGASSPCFCRHCPCQVFWADLCLATSWFNLTMRLV